MTEVARAEVARAVEGWVAAEAEAEAEAVELLYDFLGVCLFLVS